MLKRKLKLVVFDNSLSATVGKYPISDSGDRILVKKGGEAHFMPKFNHTSFLDIPRPWYKGGGVERTFFARKLATECVDFQTGAIAGPDLEQLKQSLGSTMLNQIGQEQQELPSWAIWVILLLNVVLFLRIFGVV